MAYEGPHPIPVKAGGTGAATLTGVLTGNGTSAVTASTVTQNGVLVGGAANAVSSTGVGSTGQVLQGVSASAPTYSTATYPSTATSTGTILRADGTNWSATTATYPATTTVSQLLYSSSANVVGGLATANNGALITSNTGVPSILAESATAGIPLVSGGTGVPPAWTTAVVAGGGTGATSFNINGPVISSTTTTGALSSITLGNQQILVGNTSAAPTAKSLSIVVQTFTGTGTYTPTSGMIYCTIEGVGAGGGGGGSSTCSSVQASFGGGGGGGGYSRKTVSAATIGASQSVTIGAAGTAGAVGGGTGGTGGTTSVGAIISVTGGVGGTGAGATGATYFPFVGGAGGVGSSGDVNIKGSPGAYGSVNGLNNFSISGNGGSSYFGGGGLSIYNTTAAGNTGGNYGAGGSGAGSVNSGTQQAGGAGTPGFVVITEYVLS